MIEASEESGKIIIKVKTILGNNQFPTESPRWSYILSWEDMKAHNLF